MIQLNKLHLQNHMVNFLRKLGIYKENVPSYKYKYCDEFTRIYTQDYFYQIIAELSNNTNSSLTLALFDFELQAFEPDIPAESECIITRAAKIIKNEFPMPNILLYRYDMYKIVVLIRDLDKKAATSLIISIVNELEKFTLPWNSCCRLNPEVAISTYPNGCNNPTELISAALLKLDNIKQNGYKNVGKFQNIAPVLATDERCEEEFLLVARTILKIVDVINHYTYSHSLRVAKYCNMMADKLELSARDRKNLYLAALLHDAGKIGIPGEILRKEGPLNNTEWQIMKKHPLLSAEIVAKSGHFPEIIPAIRHHHENFDGSGYPEGLKGDQIPYESRILAIADSFDAMITHRPYRSARSVNEAFEELIRCSPRQFDPAFIEVFISLK